MKHYAKGKCKICYNSTDRNNKADKCPHHDLANYAHGFCRYCYFV